MKHPDSAVIFDIDGTLAILGDRSPYDWSSVFNDRINESVRELLYVFLDSDYKILIFSGRDSCCRHETEEWLTLHDIPYTDLLMRPEGDNRKDVEIKRELYDSVKDMYRIEYAVDDRPQVCRMWHSLGLCLLKVGDPDADF